MNYFKYLVLLSVFPLFAIGFDTPRVPITVVFDRSSNNPFASSPRTYNDIFSKFPTIDSGRPGKLPATDVFTTTRQPEKGWSAENFSSYFIQNSSEESRILKDTPWCSASSVAPRVTELTSECYELTAARQLEILQRYDFYQYPGFAEYIKTFSECKAFAHDYCNKLNNPEFSKQMSYYRGLNETMLKLNQEFQQQKPAQTTHVGVPHTPTASTNCSTGESHQQLQNLRDTKAAPIQATIQAGSNLVEVKQQVHTASPQVETFVQDTGGNIADYTQCSGTVLQQATHARVIDILEQYVKLPSDSKLVREYQEKFGMYVDTARQYNQANQVSRANRILDFCQIAIDCSKAVCEGIYEGVKEAVFDILNHPVEVGLCLVAGEYVLAYQGAKVVASIADIGITYLINPEAGIAKWNAYVEPVTKLASALYNKQIPLRDGIKGVTKFAVQWKTQGKIFGGLHRACSSAANKLGKLANKVPSIKSAERMVTPEGMHFNAADNSSYNKSNKNLGGSSAAAKKVISVGNMQEFFAETKFGQTIKKYLEKTKKVNDTKAVYRVKENLREYGLKKGDQLYLDNLHKDHLEVFNKQGVFKAVLNLDGTDNIDKFNKAKGGRTLHD